MRRGRRAAARRRAVVGGHSRGKDRLDVGLFHQELGRSLAKPAHGALGEAFAGAKGGDPRFDVVGSDEGRCRHPLSASLAWFGLSSVHGHGYSAPANRMIPFQEVEYAIWETPSSICLLTVNRHDSCVIILTYKVQKRRLITQFPKFRGPPPYAVTCPMTSYSRLWPRRPAYHPSQQARAGKIRGQLLIYEARQMANR